MIGHRFLLKVEDLLSKAGCCRVLACLPDTRRRLLDWLLRRDYQAVSTATYPAEAPGHSLLPTKQSTRLVMLAKPLLPPRTTPGGGRAHSQEEYARAATATFIGQNHHLGQEEGEGVGEGEGDSGSHSHSPPLPPAQNSHLPPHWRGVQCMGASTNTNTNDNDITAHSTS